jgi:O-succinylbenzoate synthase
MSVRRSLIVELTDSVGNRGFGESAPFELPFYSAETFQSARACLVDVLLPAVIGRELTGPAACRDLLDEIARGNRMAKAGIETAWWDLHAAQARVPLVNLVDRRLEELGVAAIWRFRRGLLDWLLSLVISSELF